MSLSFDLKFQYIVIRKAPC